MLKNITVEEKEMEEKVTLHKPRQWHIYSFDFGMAFVSKENIIAHRPVSCRDYLHDTIRTFLNNKKRLGTDGHTYRPEQGDPDLVMDKLRMMFLIKSDKFENFMHGVHVLNTKEHNAGIELSTASSVEVLGKEASMKNSTFILLEGSAEYMHNPHLLSALTLILRFCTSNPMFNYTEVGDLSEAFKTMRATGYFVKDADLMSTCHDKLATILKDRNEIFEGLGTKELFPTNINHDFHSAGGIQQLCQERSPNKSANVRIQQMFRK